MFSASSCSRSLKIQSMFIYCKSPLELEKPLPPLWCLLSWGSAMWWLPSPAQLSRARGGASAGRHSTPPGTGLPAHGSDPACMGCRVPAPAVRPAASAGLEGGGQALLRALLGRGTMYGDCQAVLGLQQSGESRSGSRCGSAAGLVRPGQPCSAVALTELRDMGCCPGWAECLLGEGKACQGEARLQAAHFVSLLGGMEHTW